jgi:hypothetical protein
LRIAPWAWSWFAASIASTNETAARQRAKLADRRPQFCEMAPHCKSFFIGSLPIKNGSSPESVGRKTTLGYVDVRFRGISGQKEGRRFVRARKAVSNSSHVPECDADPNTSFCPVDAC